MADSLPRTPSAARPLRKASRRWRVPPGLLRRVATARYLDIGVSTLDRLNAAGVVPQPIRLGGSLCWSRAELAAWCRHGCPPRTEWAPLWQAVRAGRAK